MKSVMHRFVELSLAIVGIACSFPALADYAFVSIDNPGSTDTQVFGVNSAGQVTGDGLDSFGNPSPFIYDSKKGTFTAIPPAAGFIKTFVFGIAESGMTSGGVDSATAESGFVRSKNGAFTTFSHPGCADTEARAISDTGLVSGWGIGCPSDTVGFIYEPARNTFTDFLPSPSTIAQGISNSGQVVGSVVLDAGVACTGCPADRYGFLRAASGAITYFRVNGHNTSARGITDSGLVTGAVTFDDGSSKGYVTSLAGLPYESITIPAAALLQYPGAFQTTPEGITNAGAIVGIWNTETGPLHGFIATPLSNGKK